MQQFSYEHMVRQQLATEGNRSARPFKDMLGNGFEAVGYMASTVKHAFRGLNHYSADFADDAGFERLESAMDRDLRLAEKSLYNKLRLAELHNLQAREAQASANANITADEL